MASEAVESPRMFVDFNVPLVVAKKVAIACDSCKRGHYKCDGAIRCANCTIRNRVCVYSTKQTPASNNPSRRVTKRDSPTKETPDHDNIPESTKDSSTGRRRSSGAPKKKRSRSNSEERDESQEYYDFTNMCLMDSNESRRLEMLTQMNMELQHQLLLQTKEIQRLREQCQQHADYNNKRITIDSNGKFNSNTNDTFSPTQEKLNNWNLLSHWLETWDDAFHALWDCVMLPPLEDVKKFILATNNLHLYNPSRRISGYDFFIGSVLGLGAYVAGYRNEAEELFGRISWMINDEIFRYSDEYFVYGLLNFAKYMLATAQLEKKIYYILMLNQMVNDIQVRYEASGEPVNNRFFIKALTEVVVTTENRKMKEEQLKRVMAYNPVGLDFVLLTMHSVCTDMNLPITSQEEMEEVQKGALNLMDLTEKTLNEVEVSGGNGITEMGHHHCINSNTTKNIWYPESFYKKTKIASRFILSCYRAAAYCKLKNYEQAAFYADKVKTMIEQGHCSKYLLSNATGLSFLVVVNLHLNNLQHLHISMRALEQSAEVYQFAGYVLNNIKKMLCTATLPNTASAFDWYWSRFDKTRPKMIEGKKKDSELSDDSDSSSTNTTPTSTPTSVPIVPTVSPIYPSPPPPLPVALNQFLEFPDIDSVKQYLLS